MLALLTDVDSQSLNLEDVTRKHRKFLRQALLRLGVPYRDLDDVYQKLLVSISGTLHTYNPETCQVTTWLYSAALRHTLAHRERERSFEERKVAAAAEGRTFVGEPPLGPETSLIFEELRRCLCDTLKGMSLRGGPSSSIASSWT